MTWLTINAHVERAKTARRGTEQTSLHLIGLTAHEALRDIQGFARSPIEFRGVGGKAYEVVHAAAASIPFSRPVRPDLMIWDPADFAGRWAAFVADLAARRGQLTCTTAPEEVDRLLYSAVMSYAICGEVFGKGGRGSPGTFFEMAVGPVLAVLLGREETSTIFIPVGEGEPPEKVTTDLAYMGETGDTVLVVPTKISTRERISQAYVHQAILDSAKPGARNFRSVLGIVNETNVMAPKGQAAAQRTPAVCWVVETLVPGTIRLYQKYLTELNGLYYLDPPARFLAESEVDGFPRVRRLGQLLSADLPGLVEQA